MFSAIGQHAVAELLGEMGIPIEYETVSKPTGDFNALAFKDRDDYVQPEEDMPPKFAVVSSNYSATTIASSANSNLVLSTELIDTDALLSLSSNIITMGVTGWYDISVVISLDITATAAGNFVVFIQSNGGSDNVFASFSVYNGLSLSGSNFEARGTFYLVSGETLQVKLYNNTSDSIDAYVQELKAAKLDA